VEVPLCLEDLAIITNIASSLIILMVSIGDLYSMIRSGII
ncbi:unnamed protein product, partial [marine sediment metagenome]